MSDLTRFTWPESRLADAMSALLRESGLATAHSVTLDNTTHVGVETLAAHLGCEAEMIEAAFSDLEDRLAICSPAILKISPGAYLAVLLSTPAKLHLLAPDWSQGRVPLAAVAGAIRAAAEGPEGGEIERLLEDAGVSVARRKKAATSIVREQLGATRFRGGWTLRLLPGAAAKPWLRQVDAARNGIFLTIAHTLQYLLWVGSFYIVGQSALQGRIDRGWLLAWALVLLTLIPFRLLSTWLQGLIAIGVGGLLKQRLLAGALKLPSDEMRRHGIGQFLGQALEAETVETLAINGGISGLLATIELIVSAALLGRASLLVIAWWLVTLALGWRFLKHYRAWTQTRTGMTHDLVESMVGHRTRLAQQRRDQWHEDEDRKLENYIAVSRALDRSGTWLIAAVPRGWLLLGLAAIAPGFVSSQWAVADIAVALMATLLAFTAFKRLTWSLSDLAAAWAAWLQVAPLYRAAALPENHGGLIEDRAGESVGLEASRLIFRYREQGDPVLRGCSLRAQPGDRILLEGPSGGGKSTLAAVLSGLRQPESGLLLSGGLDFETLGLDRWRKRVATAPQFHENHVLTETLAFNLLMGRAWPPTPKDMEEAESVCLELGLGELLERMPGGILQMVGEGGWQLSHGERSRVYMARALLQGAGTVILDESFAALDPESLRVALDCALERARTLLVIAHP